MRRILFSEDYTIVIENRRRMNLQSKSINSQEQLSEELHVSNGVRDQNH